MEINHAKLDAIQADAEQRESLKAFLYEALDEIALEKVYASESVAGIPEAKLAIDAMFEKLDEEHGNK